jgi:hypothetical protein
LPPFFLAALAAVLNLNSPEKMNQPFDSHNSATLLTRLTHDEWKPVDLTPKHFISLVLGYCCLASLLILIFGVFLGYIFPSGGALQLVLISAYSIITFVFMHILTLMFLVVYYLSDYVYR